VRAKTDRTMIRKQVNAAMHKNQNIALIDDLIRHISNFDGNNTDLHPRLAARPPPIIGPMAGPIYREKFSTYQKYMI
jgi:hypothetical protein